MAASTVQTQKSRSREKRSTRKAYVVDEALGLVKELATAKFPESVDVSVNLGVDPRKSDQVVRGSTVLPNGTGKSVRVAVFAQGENADKAMQAAGAPTLLDLMISRRPSRAGELNFDVVIATPDAMRVVGAAWPGSRPPRTDAEPEGRHGDSGRRNRCPRMPRPVRFGIAPTRPASFIAR